jgi:hypothetical protein
MDSMGFFDRAAFLAVFFNQKLFINYRLALETREIYYLSINDRKSSCKRPGTTNGCKNERLENFEFVSRVVIFQLHSLIFDELNF